MSDLKNNIEYILVGALFIAVAVNVIVYEVRDRRDHKKFMAALNKCR